MDDKPANADDNEDEEKEVTIDDVETGTGFQSSPSDDPFDEEEN